MPGSRSRRRDPVTDALGTLPSGVTADVRIARRSWTTIRFANGRIHQPHLERSTHVSFRVAEDGRLGTATTVDVSADGLAAVRDAARSLARVAPVEPKFPGFPPDGGRGRTGVPFSEPTADLSPERATEIAARILAAARDGAPGARVAGVVIVGSERLRVVNSSGLDRSDALSSAQASVLVDRPDQDPPVSGWSEGGHWDYRRLGAERLGQEAAERVARTEPQPVEPGAYRVVLRGPAMAEALEFLGTLGFAGFGELEGWSCLAHSRGKRIAPEFVQLVDDPRSPATIPFAIDNEGTWTHRFPLVDHGVAGEAVTDLVTAGRMGRRLTGHALPPEAPFGAYGPEPTRILLAPGDASEEELIRSTRRGLLVTRFHYVRIVDPGKGIITGMTRDGTYKIDRGEVVGPVRNLRFTESVLTMLRGITQLGRERRTYPAERATAAATTPAAAVRSFRFTSSTLF
ncbi:MAG TPA: TldD/PmbA family protein [Thermoplasmata archaeon]|nr:TldD/PmbA family protein [Thermoplasmata archaeon]